MSENLLSRWSRLKREVEAGAVPPGTVAEAAVPELPSLESLAAQGLEADFSVFMKAGVSAELRRAAIQQLFAQPVFNVMDGLDVYIEDFNTFEPLEAASLPNLAHAREMLFPEQSSQPLAAAAVPEPAAIAVVPEADRNTSAEADAEAGA